MLHFTWLRLQRQPAGRSARSVVRPWVLALFGLLVSATGVLDQRLVAQQSSPQAAARTMDGIVALYDFRQFDGSRIPDVSGVSPAADLNVDDSDNVRHDVVGTENASGSSGSLEIVGAVKIRTKGAPLKVVESIRRTGSLTVEAWIETADLAQDGPARIVTLSRDSSRRNLTLGQDGNRFDVRLRTTDTSDNGIPSVATPADSIPSGPVHVVYTRDARGIAKLYVNGQRVQREQVDGNLQNWQRYRLALGDELSGGRPWRGTYYLVAIFRRPLSDEEVQRHFAAGHDAAVAAPADRSQITRSQRNLHFETKVAPILANRCLECHDTATREGGLDLARKSHAEKGGDSGKAWMPGDLSASLLWHLVESDEMPLDRAPLSQAQKQDLKQWIEDGANWSLAMIDPAVYTHGGHVAENFTRRLTKSEYIETVKVAVGIDISERAEELLPDDLRADGFSNTAYNLNVDLKHVEAYAQLAQAIVDKMDVEKFANRFVRRTRFTDSAMGKLISEMGRWILRGPVSEAEVISYRGISTSVAASGGSYEEAVGLIIEAMLQSPRFLYRIEDQSLDDISLPVSPYELATRLSYLVWGAPPDERLLEAAESGRVYDPRQIKSQVERMLEDPRAIKRSKQFLSEWLNLHRLNNLQPNREKFPDWDPRLADDMRRETLDFFQEIVWKQQRPLADLLNAQFTIATDRLAKHYGFLDDDQPSRDGVHRFDLSDVPGRGGLLTHGSVLTVGGDEASMVTRGLLVMHELLRGVVKDPPPCVDTTPVPTKPGLTQRSIALQRIGNAECAGCHSKFEPLAFGLEKFDGLGTYHEKDEHGNRLRDDGEILFPGAAQPVRYDTADELMKLLANSDRVQQSMVWKLTQFALGRPLGAADAAAVARIHRQSDQMGGTYQDVIKAIALSELVRSSSLGH